MRACLLLILAALLGVSLACAPTRDELLKAKSDATYLSGKTADFNYRKSLTQTIVAAAQVRGRGNNNFSSLPAIGTPWTLWNQSYSHVGGESYFLLRNNGAPAFPIGPLPYVQYVDVKNKIFHNANPLATQSTIYNMSMITFEFTIPGAPQPVTVCFQNATAGFDSQKSVHDSVIVNSVREKVQVQMNLGNSGHSVGLDIAVATAEGLANEFGGGWHAAMTFSSRSRLYDGVPIYWFFDQPATGPKNPPGPQPCEHNINYVGGTYDCTTASCTAQAGYEFESLESFVRNFLHPSCCTGNDCRNGISSTLLDYNTFVCLN